MTNRCYMPASGCNQMLESRYTIPAGSCGETDEETYSDLLAANLPAITDTFEKDGYLIQSAPGKVFLDNGYDHLIVKLDPSSQEAFIGRLKDGPVEEVVMQQGIKMPVDETKDKGGASGDLTEIKVLLVELLAETRRMNRRGNRSFENFDARWLNVNAAAMYCGDYSPDRFRKIAKEFEIPRHGPHRNLYDRLELDEWINNPNCYRSNRPGRRTGRRAGAMDKIAHFTLSVVRSRTESDNKREEQEPAAPVQVEPTSEERYALTLSRLRLSMLGSLAGVRTGHIPESA